MRSRSSSWARPLKKAFDKREQNTSYTNVRTVKLGSADDPPIYVVPLDQREHPHLPLMWVHAETEAGIELIQVLNDGTAGITFDNNQSPIQVRIGIPPGENQFFLMRSTPSGLTGFALPPLMSALQQASLNTPDRDVFNSLYASSGYNVGLRAGMIRFGNSHWHNTEQNDTFWDLEPYIPISGECWVLLGQDSEGNPAYVVGDSFESDEDPLNLLPIALEANTYYFGRARISEDGTFILTKFPDTHALGGGSSASEGGGALAVQIQDKTVQNTTAETSVIGSLAGSVDLIANFLEIGSVLRISGGGHYNSVGGDTLLFRVTLGGVTILDSGAFTVPAVTTGGWWYEIILTCREAGVVGVGTLQYGIAHETLRSAGPSYIDYGTALSIDVTAQWSAANVSNVLDNTVFILWQPGSGAEGGSGLPVTDHGNLDGLTDDDHPQYHNDARGDARYSQVDHATIEIIAGAGLAGGGDLTADRTLAIDISPLTAIGTVDPNNDLLIIEDATDGSIRKVAPNDLGISSGSGGGGGIGTIDVEGTAGETLAVRDAVYLASADNKWYKIDTDADPIKLSFIRGMVEEAAGIAADAVGTIRLSGSLSGFTGLTAWGEVYASTTAGGYTQTKPTSSGGVQVAIVRLGFAISTSTMIVEAKAHPVTFMLRNSSIADDATMTLKHYSNPIGHDRKISVLQTVTLSVSRLTDYGGDSPTGVKDSDVSLERYTTIFVNQTGSGTASASSSYPGYPASAAFNGNYGDEGWAANSATPCWLEYDFGTAKTIKQYFIVAPSNTYHPTGWHMQYYDGSVWQNADTRTGISFVGANQQSFSIAGNHSASRWRIYLTSATTSGEWMRELELRSEESVVENDKLSQSFQVTGAQTARLAKLYLKKLGTPTGTLTLRVETDSSGSPSGSLVDANATATFNEADVSTSYGWVSIPFNGNFNLSGSTTYWLVLSTSRSVSATDYIQWGADASSPGYANGQMKSQQSGSWIVESKDAVFDLYPPSGSYETVPRHVGYGLGTGEVEILIGDTSYANVDTQTTLKNTIGSAADLVLFVELQ